MNIATTIAIAAAAEEHEGNAQLATLPFFIIALVVFAALALVCASFRNVSNRHVDVSDQEHADAETGHGH